jgi:hypothetical protein
MEDATQTKPASAIAALLAGLQGGMLGVFWMLAWLGISATWHRRSFWTPENLMASAFYGGSAIREGFGTRTLSGLALYLLLYSTLGAVFAVVIRDRLPRKRIMLASICLGIFWYYLTFRVIWKAVSPLIFLLHVEQPTVFGHLVYGTVLGRFPVYLHGLPSVQPSTRPEPETPAVPDVSEIDAPPPPPDS